MKFPYIKFGAKTPEGGEYASFRPVIPIQVRYRGKTTRYMALLDSGADVSMFYAEMTEVLGIDLKPIFDSSKAISALASGIARRRDALRALGT